jgi:hypothetical protein
MHVLNDLAGMHAEFPIWSLVISLQEEFAKADYRLQHPDYVATCVKTDDSVAVLWNSQVRGEPEPFLSVQATRRDVPQLHQEFVDAGTMDEFLFMIEDINQNDTGAAAALVRGAVNAFKAYHLVTCLDGEPEQNHYAVQAYTQDRKYLLDIQIYYDVIQDDIVHQSRVKDND